MPVNLVSQMPMLNNDTPNSVQLHAENMLNGRVPAQNYHASLSQLPYIDSHERSMMANARGFSNMDSRVNNLMGNYVSGGNIGKQFNLAAGLQAPGHLSHLNTLRNGGPSDMNVQGSNMSTEAMLTQGLLQMQNAGMYHQNKDFSMQNEDFPALPRFRGSGTDYAVDMHPKQQLHYYAIPQMQTQQLPVGPSSGFNLPHHQQQISSAMSAGINIVMANNENRIRSHVSDFQLGSYHSPAHNMELGSPGIKAPNPMNVGPVIGPYDDVLHQYELQGWSQLQMQQGLAVDAYNNEDHTEKRPSQHFIDPYGLLGLLHSMKQSRPTPLSAHAVGIDLTTLGLNLTQPDNLHKDFFSPFAEASVKEVQDRQFTIPECYNVMQTATLRPSWFSCFRLVTLFYIFYSMPKDAAQLYAAHELSDRGWLYHKELRLWLTRDKRTNYLVKTESYERGAYHFFDPKEWKTIQLDNFVLKYEMIEAKPILPGQPGAPNQQRN